MATKVFINYRRDDSIAAAGRLHDRLAQAFGRRHVFMDVDNIPAGVDFQAHLDARIADCDVVLGRERLRELMGRDREPEPASTAANTDAAPMLPRTVSRREAA